MIFSADEFTGNEFYQFRRPFFGNGISSHGFYKNEIGYDEGNEKRTPSRNFPQHR